VRENSRGLANRGGLAGGALVLDPQHHDDVGAVEGILEAGRDAAALAGQVAAQLGQPGGKSVHGAHSRTRAPSLVRHRRFERATRE
jgi:hypothetical protein